MSTIEENRFDDRFTQARKDTLANDPPLETGQVWVATNNSGDIIRRVEIVVQFPQQLITDDSIEYERRWWICRDQPSKMVRLTIDELRIVPEFNIRYVFKLYKEGTDGE